MSKRPSWRSLTPPSGALVLTKVIELSQFDWSMSETKAAVSFVLYFLARLNQLGQCGYAFKHQSKQKTRFFQMINSHYHYHCYWSIFILSRCMFFIFYIKKIYTQYFIFCTYNFNLNSFSVVFKIIVFNVYCLIIFN